jgi:hypothetical protein
MVLKSRIKIPRRLNEQAAPDEPHGHRETQSGIPGEHCEME